MTFIIQASSNNDIDILAQMNLDLYADAGHQREISIEQMKERFQFFIQSDMWNVDLVVADDNIVGYCLWRHEQDDQDIYIRHFWLHENYRGQNYSVQMLDTLTEHCGWGDRRLRLQIFAGNDRMERYWSIQGFKHRSMILERSFKE